ncbi:hypothetical protein R3W88_031816 [Solanum pinnatisectum]|uniref:Gag-pol polyprotein n=1 Tax=Solanum pinnatisectum TaxID=50273 RepID=A0AAV9LPB2_9SOLN|nr:hypothetical protein R3W88_031816 [Solanum pinnatisectum]
MNTSRTPVRRVEEENVNEGVPPQYPQGPDGSQVPQDNQVSVDPPAMTNEEIRSAFLTLAQAMMAQVNRDVGPRVNAIESTMDSRLRDFVRMNPPYAPSLVSNPRDDMSRFVTGVSDLVKEECHTAMLHDDMNISRLIVYAQSIEESKLERKNRELKRGRSDEKGEPRSRKRF